MPLNIGTDVVSNHGGGQLDGAPSSISVLPAIVQAIQGKTEILMDDGVVFLVFRMRCVPWH